uniref:Vg receptor protein n=1 Tax=Amblyseius eharai TaxID=911334 RepID=A0A6N0A395_9ACAR|nr:Vg receptor protein [Amblyseius eharai]
MCGCTPGYDVFDGQHCRIADSCMAEGCSQQCDQIGQTVKCKCQTGFHLTTEKSCEIDAAEGPPSILFAMGHQVLELDAANHEKFAKFTDSASSVLDISIGNILYIVTADHETRRCRLMSTRGARANAIFKHDAHLGEIVDLAVDWITNNLYIVDALISIVVCRPSEEICAQIFTELGSAHYIVLDPIEGRLFWSDLMDDNKKGIYEGSMDGKLKKALVTERVTKPYGLALDLFASRLYWLEADLRVKFVRTDSGVRGELIIALPANRYPSGLAVFGDHLYWSDLLGHHSSKVASCDKLTGKNVTIHTETNSGKFIFTLRAPLMQPPRKNPCKSNPCSHKLCVISGPSEKSFACLCPSVKLVSKECELSTASFMMAASNHLIFVPSDAALGQDLATTNHAKKIPHVATYAFDDAENLKYAVEDNGTMPRQMIRIKLEDNYIQPETPYGCNVSIDYVTTMHFRLWDPMHRLLLYWLDISQAVSIGVNNPQNEECFRLENPDVTSPIRFNAVDFSRGRMYVIVVHNKTTAARVINIYRSNGKFERALKPEGRRPFRIAVDYKETPIVFVYDAERQQQIDSLDVRSGETVIIHNVSYVQHLYFWESNLVWTSGLRQHVLGNGWTVKQIRREEWIAFTSALAFHREKMPTALFGMCHENNAGCSHTCIDSLMESLICLCPIGMQLEPNGRNCTAMPQAQCQRHEFACSNGYQCVDRSLTCDNIGHCDDRSDENSTLCTKCPIGMIKCGDLGRCVPDSAICDHIDCPNSFDENFCVLKVSPSHTHKCDTATEHQCLHTQKCVPKSQRCDGRIDCAFGDDEIDCQCKEGQYACKDGRRCIDSGKVCDGVEDCWDGDDEQDCPLSCSPKMFKCGNDLCLPIDSMCNNFIECPDGSDEANCTYVGVRTGLKERVPFFCAKKQGVIWCDGECVYYKELCDGMTNCLDGRDEANCTHTDSSHCSASGQFLCSNNKCILYGLVCDEEDDCGDNSDETLPECSVIKAQNGHKTCHNDQFRCSSGKCIQLAALCDGNHDCDDGGDEGRHCLRNECDSKPCQHHCFATPEGFRCSCNEGYRLAEDRRSCEDINECAEDHQDDCSHYCMNTEGGFYCSCSAGYEIAMDNKTCKLLGVPPIWPSSLIMRSQAQCSSRHRMTRMTPQNLHSDSMAEISGLTFNAITQVLYFSLDDSKSIWKLPLGDAVLNPKIEATRQRFVMPRHISLDWVTGMYMVEGHEKIVACNLTCAHCIHMEGLDGWMGIRSLALAANEGLMFYSYWAGHSTIHSSLSGVSSVVVSSEMDGGAKAVIIESRTIEPSHLQVDFIHRRLYIADSRLQVIEHFDFQGNNRKVVLRGHHVNAFVLLPDLLIWSEHNGIFKKNWFPSKNTISSIAPKVHASLMTVLHKVRQPPCFNPCLNARCGHMCLRNRHGHVCACDAGFKLDHDNRTCIPLTDDDMDAKVHDFCHPGCVNPHGRCILHNQKLARCECSQGYSPCKNGARCDVSYHDLSSGTLIVLIVTLLLVGLIGGTILLVLHRSFTSQLSPNKMNLMLAMTYRRASDMNKKIGDDEDDQDESLGDRIPELQIQHGGVLHTNPLFQVIWSATMETGEKSPLAH